MCTGDFDPWPNGATVVLLVSFLQPKNRGVPSAKTHVPKWFGCAVLELVPLLVGFTGKPRGPPRPVLGSKLKDAQMAWACAEIELQQKNLRSCVSAGVQNFLAQGATFVARGAIAA